MKELFLSHIPTDGTGIGNGSLLALLNWDQATYDAVKRELIEEGIIAPGRGRGGSVRRVMPETANKAEVLKSVATQLDIPVEVLAAPALSEDDICGEISYEATADIVPAEEVAEMSAESADDPILVFCDTDADAALVIEAMQKHYRKTRFYSTRVGDEVKVQIQLIDFGGTKSALSPDILENARQRARDVIKPVELPPPTPEATPEESHGP